MENELDKEPNWRLILLEKGKYYLSFHANTWGVNLEIKHCQSSGAKWRLTKSIDLKLDTKIYKQPN